MRRMMMGLFCVVLMFALCCPVMAANYASRVNVGVTVNSDQSCRVSVNAVVHIEESGGLQFPIPREAAGVELNGTRVRTQKTQQTQTVDLSESIGNMTGDLSVTISYTLPGVIGADSTGQPQLQLPLLSGFESPISQLDFTVSLPGQLTGRPSFSSGYHQTDIEKSLSYTVSGNTVIGGSTGELKDHETLTMYLPVEESWFPDAPLTFFESGADDIAMIVCGVLALLYWILFLRFWPPKRKPSPTVPEGITAGQLSAVLTLDRADLSLMVFTWAQLGYLQIQAGNRRVLLQKMMDMGNERSEFEQQCFGKLFGVSTVVDTGSIRYAKQCRAVKKQSPGVRALVDKRSGNPKVFRVLCALICLFGGVSFGVAMTQDSVIQGFWIFLLAALGLVCGYQMQTPAGELFLRKSGKTVLGLFCAAIWILLGVLAGQVGIALATLAAQWLCGIMVFYGCRRTESGKQEFGQILDLRKYLKTVSGEELRRIQSMDPEYFHALAPYALALGICRGFALRFGKSRIPPCPYISCRADKLYSARHWAEKMNKTLSNMDRRSRILPYERFLAFLSSAASSKPKKKPGKK